MLYSRENRVHSRVFLASGYYLHPCSHDCLIEVAIKWRFLLQSITDICFQDFGHWDQVKVSHLIGGGLIEVQLYAFFYFTVFHVITHAILAPP